MPTGIHLQKYPIPNPILKGKETLLNKKGIHPNAKLLKNSYPKLKLLKIFFYDSSNTYYLYYSYYDSYFISLILLVSLF